MTDGAKETVAEKLKILQMNFERQLPERIFKLRQVLEQLIQSKDTVLLKSLHVEIHNLTGSSLTFNAQQVGYKSQEFEHLLHKIIKSSTTLDPIQCDELQNKFNELEGISNTWMPDGLYLENTKEGSEALPCEKKLIYLVEGDQLLARGLINELQEKGYIVQHFLDPQEISPASLEKMPAAIITGMVFSESDLAGANKIKALSDDCYLLPPVIFLSTRNDMEARLAAQRAGAAHYFVKPVNSVKLVRTLDNLTNRQPESSLSESESLRIALNKHNLISITDKKGTITFANDLFCEISGYKYEELIGKNHNILNSGYHSRDFFKNLWTTINKGKIWHGEIRNQRKDGRYYWVVSTVIPYVGSDGIPYQYISLRTDITSLVNTRSALTHAEEDFEKENAVEQ